jgi:hypothetical protein
MLAPKPAGVGTARAFPQELTASSYEACAAARWRPPARRKGGCVLHGRCGG